MFCCSGQKSVDARLQADEAETTQLVLDIVAVAQDNGLRLPREFGLILKQVRQSSVGRDCTG
jgi:hypothetical protein